MISRETENVQSSSEVEQAFRALTSGEKPFITKQELYAVSCRDHLYIRVFIGLSPSLLQILLTVHRLEV